MKSADIPKRNVPSLVQLSSSSERARLEFLPAAIEIVETPASPVGRAVGGALVFFFLLALAWSYFGHIDIVATTQGKIVAVGRTKVVQPIEAGIVTAIRVADGDRVSEGQIVVELDKTASTAERNRIRHELLRAQLDVARLLALGAGSNTSAGAVNFNPPAQAPTYEVARTRAAMLAQADQQGAKLATLDQQIEQKAAEAEQIAEIIAKIEAGLPIIESTAQIREAVMRMQFGNQLAHLEVQLKLTEQRHELRVQQRRALEVAAARRALEWQREQIKLEYARAVVTELVDAETKASQLAEDLIRAEKRIEDQTLRAPISGTVQQLVLHTVGGVVTPAQVLMAIVPTDAGIEIEAMLLNKDVGFVQEGNPAEIKIDTFNFTRYGLLQGTVISVSRDAIIRDRGPGQAGADPRLGAQAARTSEPPGQELLYAARISLDRSRMLIDDRMVDLSPGMAVTVEIKTGQRRVIEFLLSPLLRTKQESLRER
jgi:hemolysin D